VWEPEEYGDLKTSPKGKCPDCARFNPKFRTKTEYGEKWALTPSKLRVSKDP